MLIAVINRLSIFCFLFLLLKCPVRSISISFGIMLPTRVDSGHPPPPPCPPWCPVGLPPGACCVALRPVAPGVAPGGQVAGATSQVLLFCALQLGVESVRAV